MSYHGTEIQLSRLITLVLIGFLALFSAPRAGMTHETVHDGMASMVAEADTAARHLGLCPDCADRPAGLATTDAPCSHGAICGPFTAGPLLDLAVSRALQPVSFAALPTPKTWGHAPALDLPPPRIWVAST